MHGFVFYPPCKTNAAASTSRLGQDSQRLPAKRMVLPGQVQAAAKHPVCRRLFLFPPV